MTPARPDTPDPTPAACAAALAFLQRRLDGDPAVPPPAVATHLAECADCRERFRAATALEAALARLDRPGPPALLTERLVSRVRAHARRRRRWFWTAGATLAASVALAVWLARPGPVPAPPPDAPDMPAVVHDASPTAPPTLRQGFTEAGEAVVSLTRRTAREAVGVGRQLVPDVPLPPAPWPPTVETAALPLDDARQALADGFEPVATSARRAARLFLRDLPLPGETSY
jgi:hypothetical protein